jgi:hypothetical protein
MNRISLRITNLISIASLATAMTLTALSQMQITAPNAPENLNTHQLNTLVETAKTPAEHQRIAEYYEARAQDYQARANVHQAMVEQYKADATRVNNKNYASTIGHCEYFAQRLRDQAAEAQEQAKLHQQMAMEAAARN